MTACRLAGLLAGIFLMACKPAQEPSGAGDFAVLARSETGFEQARPGRALRFPEDHGAHPGFRIEWWYLTANLEDDQGQPYGAQWTLFRSAVRTPDDNIANAWQSPQVFMAHMAITTPKGHVAYQRYARGGDHGGLAQAGVTTQPFTAWLDDWTLASVAQGWLPLEVIAVQGKDGFRLALDSDLPPVPQGDAGFSQKHPSGGGSHYYSHPWLRADGELLVAGQRIAVSGQAWMDHEWSSQFLQADQAGWDWFALHLDSGDKLMLFRLRPAQTEAGVADFAYGALWSPDGGRTELDAELIDLRVTEHEKVAGRLLPLAWRIELPQVGRSLEVRALHPQQWMDVDFAYWEGVVLVIGEGPENTGRGYLELTGYPGGG